QKIVFQVVRGCAKNYPPNDETYSYGTRFCGGLQASRVHFARLQAPIGLASDSIVVGGGGSRSSFAPHAANASKSTNRSKEMVNRRGRSNMALLLLSFIFLSCRCHFGLSRFACTNLPLARARRS